MKVPKIHRKIENNDYTQMYSFKFHGINRETVILHNNVKVSMLILKMHVNSAWLFHHALQKI